MFYENLTNLCAKSGISLTTLITEKLKMSSGNITRWKNGTTPNSKVLKAIADYFGVSTDYLLNGSDNKKSSTEAEGKDDLEQVILARSSRPIPEDDLMRIKNLIDSTIDTFLEALDNEQKHKRR